MTHLNGFSKNLSSLLSGFKNGGGERARTVDPLRARQVLSQLSYGPSDWLPCGAYKWWVWEDLNFRPHPYQCLDLSCKPYIYRGLVTLVFILVFIFHSNTLLKITLSFTPVFSRNLLCSDLYYKMCTNQM